MTVVVLVTYRYAEECGVIVGPHSTKLPQSWDTGSDQPTQRTCIDHWLTVDQAVNFPCFESQFHYPTLASEDA